MYISVNNINLYFEEYGNGTPLILLHGNGEDHSIFDALIEKMAKKTQIFAIDSRCHGKSERKVQLSYQLMADDIISFIKAKNISKPALCGFSDGGIIGLLIASQNPDLLSKLIICGANCSPKGLKLKYRLYFKLLNIYKKSRKLTLMLTEPNITKLDLQKINIQTTITIGEKDLITKKETFFIADNIKNSNLHILKGETHDSYVVHSQKLYEILKPIFCDKK